MADLVEVAESIETSEVRGLVCGPNWRERLVGQTLGGMVPYEAFEADLMRSLDGTGWCALPAAAALAVSVKLRGATLLRSNFPDIAPDPNETTDNAVGAAITYVESGRILQPDSKGGPRFEVHVRYHEWVRETGIAELKEICREASNDTWKGRERACPSCATRFTSVQNLGQCPKCRHIFYASDPLYERS